MKIVLIDDHTATRQEMAALIQKEEDLRVTGQASTAEEGVTLVKQLQPDLVIMDIVMPGMTGIEATRTLHATFPDIRVLALSNHTGTRLLKTVLRAGAAGYVRKDHAYEELIPAIRTVSNGDEYIGKQVHG